MLHILDKSLLGDCLNQSHDVGSISTRAIVGDSNVPNLLKNEIKDIKLGLLNGGLEQIPLKLRHPRGITLSRCQGLPNDSVKDNQLRLEISDGRSLKVGGLIHGSHLIEPNHIAIMKIQRMLGRTPKTQDRGKVAYSDRILGAIGHPSNVSVVLVEEESRIELKDHFIISIIQKSHDILEPMILTHLNDILEGLTVLVLLHESPIHPLHRNNWSLLPLVDGAVPIRMKVGPKTRIWSSLVRIITSGVPMIDDGLGVLFHVVHRGPLTTRVLNGRVDAERFFFFLIRRNQRRRTENDFVSMGFLCFGG
jgi:hypothetical protein